MTAPASARVVPTLADLGPVRGATARRWYWYRDDEDREWHPALVEGWTASDGEEIVFVRDGVWRGPVKALPPQVVIDQFHAEFAPMPPPPEGE